MELIEKLVKFASSKRKTLPAASLNPGDDTGDPGTGEPQ